MRGEYRHAIDAKNRIFLPAKLREALGENLVVSKGTDKCVNVYSEEKWAEFEEKISTLPSFKARKVKVWMNAFAFDVTVDVQGRIAIPPQLREYAALEKAIVSIGVDDHMEIYNEEYYDATIGSMDPMEVESILIEMGM